MAITFPGKGNVDATARGLAVSPQMESLARFGYAAKGFVHALTGLLALRAIAGLGGDATDSRGALSSLADAPFGSLLLGVLGVGLAAYAIWRFIELFALPIRAQRRGKDLAKHFGYLFSGLAYASLSMAAFDLLAGRGAGGDGTRGLVAEVLSRPFGQFVVIVAALAGIAYGVQQIVSGVKERFLAKLDVGAMDDKRYALSRRLGKLGYVARGVVFSITGAFLFAAGVSDESRRARGLDGVFDFFASMPGGAILVALLAVGLFAYGVHCMIDARYRRLLSD
jgi:hypothetical protein